MSNTESCSPVLVHDFDDEVEDGLEMEYTFKRPPAPTADLDSELALSEIYMGVKDKDEWEHFKGEAAITYQLLVAVV